MNESKDTSLTDDPTGKARGLYMHPSNDPELDLFGNPPKNRPDWGHRRGEPRVFTLLWMIYLMGATVLMFSSMATAFSISTDVTRPAARTMFIMVAVGFSVLWPMVRFSQRAILSGHVRFAIRDALVLSIPMQAIIWPQTLPVLANWSIEVVAAISAFFIAWIIILAGVQAFASQSIQRNNGSELVRITWMLIIILLVFGAPIFGSITVLGVESTVSEPRIGWMLSPITGLLEIVRDRDELGSNVQVFSEHWRVIIALLCVGGALLLVAKANEVARARL
jgi:hypothetical protein